LLNRASDGKEIKNPGRGLVAETVKCDVTKVPKVQESLRFSE
jgi:hypothetical protein